jgi:hypothetical protein
LNISVKPLFKLLKTPDFLSCPVDAPSVDGGVLDDLLVNGFVKENLLLDLGSLGVDGEELDDDDDDESEDELDELVEGAGDDELLDVVPESSDI